VAKAYMLAWELGCKGLTVYVAGSREKVVLETRETAQAKQDKGKHDMIKEQVPVTTENAPVSAAATETPAPEPLPLFKNEVKRPRARVLKGYTYRVETPLGTTFVTINENGGDQPFELFMHTSKAGSDTAAVSEAMGRMISYILRMNSPVEPRKRLREVVRQMEGIGGGRPLGLGPNRVRSLPDGIAQVLDEYLHGDLPDSPAHYAEAKSDSVSSGEWAEGAPGSVEQEAVGPVPGQMPLLPVNFKGDLCPECGQAAVVNEEGCRKCYACGYSEC
jgi:ribonucleoside-diphosphate reductase alpha chain